MINSCLSFVPARSGSKGIVGKNLALLCNQPLIAYTYKLLQQLGDLTHPFISTDCPNVLSLASEFGFNTEYLRPKELAQDNSSIIDAIFHALEWLESQGSSLPQTVLLLQPTSPLRTIDQVRSALKIFEENDLDSLVSVHEMREHPYECVGGSASHWEFVKEPSSKVVRRQDYPEKFYYIDGSIYMASVDFLLQNKSFLKRGATYLFETESRFNIDIDEPEDLEVAQSLMKFRNKTTKYGK
jgi:CMP-N,N'-diacetyllegionaminic acid synthase